MYLFEDMHDAMTFMDLFCNDMHFTDTDGFICA